MDTVREMSMHKSAPERYSSNEEFRYIRKDLRDFVFHRLFASRENVLEAYRCLHPEDLDVTLDDVEITTIEIPNRRFVGNDLSFTIRGKKIVLIEAQTTENENTPLRILGYLIDLYQIYLKKRGEGRSIYQKKAVMLPEPEAYVIFSNTEEDRDIMSLTQIHYPGNEVLEFKVKVLTRDRTKGILHQYIRFCEIYVEEVKKFGMGRDTWGRILLRCSDEQVLTQFLATHGEELMENYHFLMTTDEAWEEELDALKKESESIRRENASIKQENESMRKESESIRRDADDFKKKAVQALREKGASDEELCLSLGIEPEELERYL